MIKKNADRMIRLLNNILDYERIELGTFEMHFREVNLKDVFQEVIAAFTPLAEEKQVTHQDEGHGRDGLASTRTA